jgi:hypothetical protein
MIYLLIKEIVRLFKRKNTLLKYSSERIGFILSQHVINISRTKKNRTLPVNDWMRYGESKV